MTKPAAHAQHKGKTFSNRLTVLFIAGIVCTAGLFAYGLHTMTERNEAQTLQKIVTKERGDTHQYADEAEMTFKQIYQNLRTLAFLPDIRELQRHAENVSPGAKETIQQVYNNIASNVSVSEIYFVPASFSPGTPDAVTGKPEEPAMMYDQLITWDTKKESGETEEQGAPEIEDEEYALIAKQIAHFRQENPDLSTVKGLDIPMTSGPVVTTCDNTDFNHTHNEYDRKGLVFSVPYFDRTGKFAGVVSAIIRLRVLEQFLPEKDAAFVNVGEGYGINAATAGQAEASKTYVIKGEQDPNLIYSEAVKLKTPDRQAGWTLWRAVPNATFENSSELIAIRHFAYAGYAVIGGLCLLAIIGLLIAERRFVRPAKKVVHALVDIAGGNIEQEVPYTERRDLLGDISRAVTRFKTNALELQQAEAERRQRAQNELEEQSRRQAEAAERARTVLTVVENLGAGLRRLADCDIRMTIDEKFSEEFEKIRADFNRSIKAFQETLEQVLSSTAAVEGDSRQMLEASQELASQVEQQASAIEQASAALEEINATLAESRNYAATTRSLVREASERAAASGTVVEQTINAMHRIEASSGEISTITSLIDQIAFQTNLLALNAGVEAARAGEAGKGFAVVAHEVRELAQRSSSAAHQIKALVDKSALEVANGVKLVGETGTALGSISEYVARVDANMDIISNGIAEQATGLAEVTSGLHQIDSATQRNAASGRMAADLSQRVSHQAHHLMQLVQHFQLASNSQPSAQARRRVA
ncbi:methyl-accepting chemotaxis protein [Oryzifoliimicrobium ureilyticus]|uniref:methyl-accepting chemotaxis protein n=1 Tax=Oryzifoliimicrobium ureilyticus TaxID=3113724 RepID=UPI0030762258